MRIPEAPVVALLPRQDAVAGHPELTEHVAHERRDDAEILGQRPRRLDVVGLRQLFQHRAEHAPAPRALRVHSFRIEVPALSAVLPLDPLAEEPHHVIEPEAVVEVRRVPRARADPGQIVGLHGEPVVGGEPPVLPVGGVGVRRGAERHVELELRGVRPDVGALGAHDEGEIAHELDAELAHLRPGRLPLLVQRPLHVRDLEQALRLAGANLVERDVAAVTLRIGPRRPSPAVVRLAQRRVEREVVEPRALALDECGEAAGSRGLARPLAGVEPLERGAQRLHLQRTHDRVAHPGSGPARLERPLALVAERLVDGGGVEILHRVDVDVDGIEAEGGERAVGARLPP